MQWWSELKFVSMEYVVALFLSRCRAAIKCFSSIRFVLKLCQTFSARSLKAEKNSVLVRLFQTGLQVYSEVLCGHDKKWSMIYFVWAVCGGNLYSILISFRSDVTWTSCLFYFVGRTGLWSWADIEEGGRAGNWFNMLNMFSWILYCLETKHAKRCKCVFDMHLNFGNCNWIMQSRNDRRGHTHTNFCCTVLGRCEKVFPEWCFGLLYTVTVLWWIFVLLMRVERWECFNLPTSGHAIVSLVL